MKKLTKKRQADEIEITPAMIAAGVKTLRESGFLEYELSGDSVLVQRILQNALARRRACKRNYP